MSDSPSDIELIDPGDDRSSDVTMDTSSQRLSSLALVAGLVVVAVVVWLLTRSGQPDDPGPDEAVIEEGVGDTPATTLILPTSRPVSTSLTTLVPGVAVLSEQTGMWLFYGGDDNLQRLDLDDGVTNTYGLRAHPIASLQGELVVSSAAANAIGWVGLDNPAEQAEGWKDGRVAFETDGVHAQFLVAGEWSRIEFPSGRITDTLPAFAPAALPFDRPGRPALVVPGPGLVSTTNGIYERGTDGEYQRVRGSGEVLLHDPERALIQECGAELLDCRSTWFERTDWSRLALPAPQEPVAFAELLGGGTWLHVIDVSGRHQILLLEPEPGSALEESFAVEVAIESLNVSPDGRWLAVKQPDREVIELIDLTTGQTVKRYTGFSADGSGSLLFVAKPTSADNG